MYFKALKVQSAFWNKHFTFIFPPCFFFFVSTAYGQHPHGNITGKYQGALHALSSWHVHRASKTHHVRKSWMSETITCAPSPWKHIYIIHKRVLSINVVCDAMAEIRLQHPQKISKDVLLCKFKAIFCLLLCLTSANFFQCKAVFSLSLNQVATWKLAKWLSDRYALWP